MIIPADCKYGRSTEVDRKATYPIKHVLDLIASRPHKKKMNMDGDDVYIGEKRLVMFKRKGVKCTCCGLQGKFFAKEVELHNLKNNNCKTYALQLYALKDGHEVMMTMDHTIPISHDGESKLYNLRPMCYLCNQSKANKKPNMFTCMFVKFVGVVGPYYRSMKRKTKDFIRKITKKRK